MLSQLSPTRNAWGRFRAVDGAETFRRTPSNTRRLVPFALPCARWSSSHLPSLMIRPSTTAWMMAKRTAGLSSQTSKVSKLAELIRFVRDQFPARGTSQELLFAGSIYDNIYIYNYHDQLSCAICAGCVYIARICVIISNYIYICVYLCDSRIWYPILNCVYIYTHVLSNVVVL